MPLSIKNVTWTQTEEWLDIIIKLNNNDTKSVDIITSKRYLKVHSPPFLFELFLLHDIDDSVSRCKLFPGVVQFSLKKSENFEWTSLEQELDNDDKNVVRNDAIKEIQKLTAKKQKDMVAYREKIKREEIMQSTSRDAKTREDYEKVIKGIPKFEGESKHIIDEQKNFITKTKEIIIKKLPASVTVQRESSSSNLNLLPKIRESNTISVTFSNRNFITPKRESQEEEERQWLLKQSGIRKAIGFTEEDLRPEERNPQWLKEKGDNFYKKGNFLGAISAYSTAIRMSDQFWELYFNRAAAHFSLQNFQKCVSIF